jgi:hypothetical protein
VIFAVYSNSIFILDLLNLMITKEQQGNKYFHTYSFFKVYNFLFICFKFTVRRTNINRDAWVESSFQPIGTSSFKQLVLAFPTINNALDYVKNHLVNNEANEVYNLLYILGMVYMSLNYDLVIYSWMC